VCHKISAYSKAKEQKSQRGNVVQGAVIFPNPEWIVKPFRDYLKRGQQQACRRYRTGMQQGLGAGFGYYF
jgi:hypothetical protein